MRGSNMLWAYAKLEHRPAALLQVAAAAVLSKLPSFNPQATLPPQA